MPTYKQYHARLSSGLCPECGGQRDDSYIICSHCRRYHNTMSRKNYDSARNKRNCYAYRDRKARDGCCISCGNRLDNPSYASCPKCRTYYSNRYYQNKLLSVVSDYYQPLITHHIPMPERISNIPRYINVVYIRCC